MAVTKNLINIGDAQITSDLTANKIIKRGGSGNQYLMADGSVSTGGGGGQQGVTGPTGSQGVTGPTGQQGITGPVTLVSESRSYRFKPNIGTSWISNGKFEVAAHSYCVADARVIKADPNASYHYDNIFITLTFDADFNTTDTWDSFLAHLKAYDGGSTFVGFVGGLFTSNNRTLDFAYNSSPSKMEDNWYCTMSIRHIANWTPGDREISQVVIELHGVYINFGDYENLFTDGSKFNLTFY